MLFSRIVTLLAGALVGAVVMRWKDDTKAKDAPWRPDLDDLHKKLLVHLDSRDAELAARIADFQPRIEALAAELKVVPDGRIDELAVRIAQLQPKIEALAAGLAKPDPRVEAIAVRLTAVESRAGTKDNRPGSDFAGDEQSRGCHRATDHNKDGRVRAEVRIAEPLSTGDEFYHRAERRAVGARPGPGAEPVARTARAP